MSSIKTVNPATNEVVKEYPEMSSQQIDGILGQADKAFKEWRKVSFAKSFGVGAKRYHLSA